LADVLFTHSYFLTFDPKEARAMMPYPPLGTLYAASAARAAGHTVALFDSMLASSEEEILPHLRRHRPAVLVIYDDDFNYLTKMCLTRMREAAFTLASLGRREGCTVVVHGSDPADHAADYLGHGADFVVAGEGEVTLTELLDHLLRQPRAPETIHGIVYLHEGQLVRTPPREVLRDLDRLPLPARDLLDLERYRQTWVSRHGFFSLNIVTTRGCPFHCNWCAKPLYGQVYNTRSPAAVVREMIDLAQTARPDHLWFCDDIFGLKPGWIEEFADRVEEAGVRIPFRCLARADLLLKGGTIGQLKRAGCETVWIGAESGSQRILDAMEKGTTVGQIREACAKLKSQGIRVGFFIQYGYPGETRDDIEQTLGMIRECLPDDIGISVSYPLPGTPFHARVLEELGEKRNWVDSADLEVMFRGTYPADFYRALHRLTHKHLRMLQGREEAIRLLRGRGRLHRPIPDRRVLRKIAASLFHAVTLPPIQARLNRQSRERA
jgi:radical SAM superfamily enzyme YgiQ (UPF0313 family)